MKVSIIIVSYNEKDYILDAFNSCLNQDLDDFEIIIGDDGSSDGSIDLIKELHKQYPDIIKYFVMDRSNLGFLVPSIRCSNVLKKAFELSSGDYINIMSADDKLIGNKKIELQSRFLDKHPDYASCYCDYNKYFEEEKKSSKTVTPYFVNDSYLWSLQYFHISCFLFRRKCLLNLLPLSCDDTGLMYSILISGKSKHIHYLGFQYRQRQRSIMSSSSVSQLNVLEVLLFQDILNSNKSKMVEETYCRFYKPILNILESETEIPDAEKYVGLFSDSNGIIKAALIDKDKNKCLFDLCKKQYSYFNRRFFLRRIINKIINILRRG